MSAYEETI
uniref:Uncharacterized protein n=1 Tax=Anguilla anguilla TaxID=7936 RepID=A0A0E9VY72_ANGAN